MYQELTKMRESASQKQAWIREKMKLQEIKIILYKQGEQKSFDGQSPYFLDILYECERLIKTADDAYRLYASKELIEEIKKKKVALEVIYPEAVNLPIWELWRVWERKKLCPQGPGQKATIKRFLIPLKGEYSPQLRLLPFSWSKSFPFLTLLKGDFAVIFFTKDDGSHFYGNACNSQGTGKLKKILKKMKIKID
ncbi:MAG: hypothetical protein AB1297_07830 [bacterium]